MRIVTLVPSATDIVCALGLSKALVGVSHECDHPDAVGLPVVTRSAVPAAPETAPGLVDAAVTAAVAAGDSLYIADRARIAQLRPDVVVGQTICDVCAVSAPLAQAALPPDATLVTLAATSIAGLQDDLTHLGAALDRRAEAGAVAGELDAMFDALPRAPARRMLALEWSDPPFLGGHWVPELVERIGSTHVLSSPGEASRRASWDEIRDAAPELVVFMPCGYDLEAAVREAEACAPLRALGVPVWATDATRLFSRCTPHAVALGARTLSAISAGADVDPSCARAAG